MKFRKDFVTNSSSSSFVCDICGNVESGWDMSLQEAEMVECVNGHTICQDEMLSAPREVMLRLIQEEIQQSWSRFNGMTDTELNEKTDEELEEMMLERDDGYYSIPEECCPICQFIEYSNKDLAKTVFSYGCSPDGVDAPKSALYVYRMTMTNEDGDVVEYPPFFMRYRCEQMGVNCVPLLWSGFVPESDSPGEWVKTVAECYYDGADPIGKSHVREGVVCRIVNRPKFTAYKHKNFAFKVLEGIIKEVASAPDMEESQEVADAA